MRRSFDSKPERGRSPGSPPPDTSSPRRSAEVLVGQRRQDHFRIFVRLRPFLPFEIDANTKGNEKFKTDIPAIDLDTQRGQVIVRNEKHLSAAYRGDPKEKKVYPKDQDGSSFPSSSLLWSFSSKPDWERSGRPRDRLDIDRHYADNEGTFNAMNPAEMVADLYKGFSHCIVSCGTNNSGKTHTMYGGKEETASGGVQFSPGVVPRFLEMLMAARPGQLENRAPGEDKNIEMEVRFVRVYQEEVEDLLSGYPHPPLRGQKSTIQLQHPKSGQDTLAEAKGVKICGDDVDPAEYEQIQKLLWSTQRAERCRPLLAEFVDEDRAETSKDKIQEKRAHYVLEVRLIQLSTFRAEGEDDYGDADEKAATSSRVSAVTFVDMGWDGGKPSCQDQPTHNRTVKSVVDFRNLVQKMCNRSKMFATEERQAEELGVRASDGKGAVKPTATFGTKLTQTIERCLGTGDWIGSEGNAGCFVTMLMTVSPWHGARAGTGTALDVACLWKGIRCVAAPTEDKKLRVFQAKAEEQHQIKVAEQATLQEMKQVQKEISSRQQALYRLQWDAKLLGMKEWMMMSWVADCDMRQKELVVGLLELKGLSAEERKKKRVERMNQPSWPRAVYPPTAGPHDAWAGFDRDCNYVGKRPRYPGDPGKYPLAFASWGLPSTKAFVRAQSLEQLGIRFAGGPGGEFPPEHPRSLMVQRDGDSYRTEEEETAVFFDGALRHNEKQRLKAFGNPIGADAAWEEGDGSFAGQGVDAGGIAAKAGVCEGMFLVKVDGQPVHNLVEAKEAVDAKAGKKGHVLLFGQLIHRERPDYLGRDFDMPSAIDFPGTLRGVAEHLGPIRSAQAERDELLRLQAEIDRLTQQCSSIRGHITEKKQSMAAEERQGDANDAWISKLNELLSECEANAIALKVQLDRSMLEDSRLLKAPPSKQPLSAVSDRAQQERDRLCKGMEGAAQKLQKVVGANKDLQRLGKVIADARSGLKQTEQQRKQEEVKARGAKRRAVHFVLKEINDIWEVRNALGDMANADAAGEELVQVYAAGGVHITFAPTPLGGPAVLRSVEPKMREAGAGGVVVEPKGKVLAGRKVVKINGKPVADAAAAEALREPEPDRTGKVRLHLAPGDPGYSAYWQGLWTEVLRAAGAQAVGDTGGAPSAPAAGSLDSLFLAKAAAARESYFAQCDDGVSEQQKAHNARLREALEKLAGTFAQRIPKESRGLLQQLNDAVAALAKATGGQAHADPMAGSGAGDWEGSLRRAAELLQPHVKTLQQWERERSDLGIPQSPDLDGTKGSIDHTPGEAGSGDIPHDREWHEGQAAALAGLSLESINGTWDLARAVRGVTRALLNLCAARRRLEHLWDQQLWQFAETTCLHRLRDEEKGHYAGKALADAINGYCKCLAEGTAAQSAVDSLEKQSGETKGKLEAAKKSVAELSARESTQQKQKAEWEQKIAKQCCTVL